MAEYRHIKREFGPVWDANSAVLILGSFPSVKSREANFYYGHPQNRFWRVMAQVLGCPMPQSTDEKREMLLAHRVALWDVLEECDIIGSSDGSIKNAVPVDIMTVLSGADIRQIYCNGTAAYTLFMRYLAPVCARSANAAWPLDRLCAAWQRVRDGV